jgi:membrane protein DedA with SNARE-associated domain
VSPATVALFGWVLVNQAGVPVPVAPWLVAMGALARDGRPSLAVVLASAVLAALAADLVWYGLGRWGGAQALARGARLLRLPPAALERATRAVRIRGVGVMWGARFLPELNPIAAALAGATRVPLARFLRHAAGSALAWAGAWAGGGYVLRGATPGGDAPWAGAWPVLTAVAGLAALTLVLLIRARWASPSEARSAA